MCAYDPAQYHEDFFIEQIQDQLARAGSPRLTDSEVAFLRTPVPELGNDPDWTPERSRDLDRRCVDALAAAYAYDTGLLDDNRWINAQVESWKFAIKGSMTAPSASSVQWFRIGTSLAVGSKRLPLPFRPKMP